MRLENQSETLSLLHAIFDVNEQRSGKWTTRPSTNFPGNHNAFGALNWKGGFPRRPEETRVTMNESSQPGNHD